MNDTERLAELERRIQQPARDAIRSLELRLAVLMRRQLMMLPERAAQRAYESMQTRKRLDFDPETGEIHVFIGEQDELFLSTSAHELAAVPEAANAR